MFDKILEYLGVKCVYSNSGKTKIIVGMGSKQYRCASQTNLGTSRQNKATYRNPRKSSINNSSYHTAIDPALVPLYLRHYPGAANEIQSDI